MPPSSLQLHPASACRHVRHVLFSTPRMARPCRFIATKPVNQGTTSTLSQAVAALYHPESVFPPLVLAEKSSPESMQQFAPPELEVVEPPQPKDGKPVGTPDRFQYYLRLGKSVGKFYWAGLKKIFSNFKEYQRFKSHLSTFQGQSATPSFGAVVAHSVLYQSPTPITRRQFQLLYRGPSDFYKLIPFSLVFLVCGEFTPLVLPFLPTAILPGTCRRQQDRLAVTKKYTKRLRFARDQMRLFPPAPPQVAASNPSDLRLLRHSAAQEVLWGYAVRSSPYSFLIPYFPKRWIPALDRSRLFRPYNDARHFRIVLDTILIMREGGFGKLSADEIVDYCLFVGHGPFIKFAELPPTEAMRTQMAASLDAYATRLLDHDFTRLDPSQLFLLDFIARSTDP